MKKCFRCTIFILYGIFFYYFFLQNQHCVLNIHMEAVERLHQNQIYPIVLLIKFKSVKQIKEIKDPRYLAEKISQKDAKNMYESTQTLEADYKPYISSKIKHNLQ